MQAEDDKLARPLFAGDAWRRDHKLLDVCAHRVSLDDPEHGSGLRARALAPWI